MTTAARKPKKCKVCLLEFVPNTSLQKACSVACAIIIARKSTEKVERKLLADRKLKLKTRSDWMKEAQVAFNAYIRARDKDLPCISCGTFDPKIQYCAGHYLTVGAHPALRFEELNVHRQCNSNCNLNRSGNIANYRIGLLLRIGEEKVKWLEGPHPARKYTIEDLQAIKADFKAKLKALEKTPYYPV